MVVNAVGAWTEETLPAIPNTAKHLADVVGRAHHKCPILQNRTVCREWLAHEEDHDDDHSEAGQVGEGERFASPCHCGDGGHDRFAGAEHGGTHRADAHHACHVEPEREERAAYDGVEQQEHASRVQCGNVRPRLRERA